MLLSGSFQPTKYNKFLKLVENKRHQPHDWKRVNQKYVLEETFYLISSSQKKHEIHPIQEIHPKLTLLSD